MESLFERFSTYVVHIDLLYKLGTKDTLNLPELEKIILHGSTKKMAFDKKQLLRGGLGCEFITLQKSIPTKARRPIAAFSLREKSSMGIKCTLRSRLMYDFLTRCIYIYFPRMNPFSPKEWSAQKRVWNCSLSDIRSFLEVEYFFQHFDSFPGCNLSIFFKKKKHSIPVDMLFLSAFCIPLERIPKF
jgi:large subunit ribosomal protein L5